MPGEEHICLTPDYCPVAHHIPQHRDLLGRTPLHHSLDAPKPSVETVAFLLAHGANPNLRENSGKTAVDLARARGGKLFEMVRQHSTEKGAKQKSSPEACLRIPAIRNLPLTSGLDKTGEQATLRSSFAKLQSAHAAQEVEIRDRTAWVSTLERALSESKDAHSKEVDQLKRRVEEAEAKLSLESGLKQQVTDLEAMIEDLKAQMQTMRATSVPFSARPSADTDNTVDWTEWTGALTLGGIPGDDRAGLQSFSGQVSISRPANGGVTLATTPCTAVGAPRSPQRTAITVAKSGSSSLKGYFASPKNEELAISTWPGLDVETAISKMPRLPEVIFLGSGVGALAVPKPSGLVPSKPRETTLVAIAQAILDDAKKAVVLDGSRPSGAETVMPRRDGRGWIDRLGSSRLAVKVPASKVSIPSLTGALDADATINELKERTRKLSTTLDTIRTSFALRVTRLENELAATRLKSIADVEQVRNQLLSELAEAKLGLLERSHRLRAAQNETETNRAEVSRLRADLIRIRSDVNELEKRNKSLQNRLGAGKGKIEAARRAIEELSETLELRNAELNAATKRRDELEAMLLRSDERAELFELRDINAHLMQKLEGAKEDGRKLREQLTASNEQAEALEEERTLWMDLAQEQENDVSQLTARFDSMETELMLRNAQRLEAEPLRKRIMELEAELAKPESQQRKLRTAAEELQKTNFQFRAEWGGTSLVVPIRIDADRAEGSQPTPSAGLNEEPIATAHAVKGTATGLDSEPEPSQLQVNDERGPEVLSAAKESQQTTSIPPQRRPTTDGNQVNNKRSGPVSFFEQLLVAEREISERSFAGSEIYDRLGSNLQAWWTSIVFSILPPIKPDQLKKMDSPVVLGSIYAGSPVSLKADQDGGLASPLAFEELRLKREAAEARERKAVKAISIEKDLRPQIDRLRQENRQLWRQLTAATTVGDNGTFWGLSLLPRVSAEMAALIAASASLNVRAGKQLSAIDEVAKLRDEQEMLVQTLRSICARDKLVKVVAEPQRDRERDTAVDFTKHRMPIVRRTVPKRLSAEHAFDFAKRKVPTVAEAEARAIEERAKAAAAAATSEKKRRERMRALDEDILLNHHAFEALLPTVAAADEPIQIAEAEKRETIIRPVSFRRSSLLKRDSAGPLVAGTTFGNSGNAVMGGYSEITEPRSESGSMEALSLASAVNQLAAVAQPPNPTNRAAEFASQILDHGNLHGSELEVLLVPHLRVLATSASPSSKRIGITAEEIESEDLEVLTRKRNASKVQMVQLASFIARRRRIAAHLGEAIATYNQKLDDVRRERDQALEDFASAHLELLESQFLVASTSSVASRTVPGSSEAAHREHIDRLSEREEEIFALRRIATAALNIIEEELKDWTAVQQAWDATAAAETRAIADMVQKQLTKLENEIEHVKMQIPDEHRLSRRIEMSQELASLEVHARGLKAQLWELNSGSQAGTPSVASHDSFSDIESDLVGSFEHVGTGRRAIVNSDGASEEDMGRGFFFLSTSIAGRPSPSRESRHSSV